MGAVRRSVDTHSSVACVSPFQGEGRIDARHVKLKALPDGVLGYWLRVLGQDRFIISELVAVGEAAAVAAHLLSHAGATVAEALDQCCRCRCEHAERWLPLTVFEQDAPAETA
jgi:hypothetical protein